MFCCVCKQYYSSERDQKNAYTAESNPSSEEESPSVLIRELLDEALQQPTIDQTSDTNSGYSTSYCWPALNNGSLGLKRWQPAQSCEHILNVNVTSPNGFYWIDPNQGCSSDAILVHCNFTSSETCLYPNSTQVNTMLY